MSESELHMRDFRWTRFTWLNNALSEILRPWLECLWLNRILALAWHLLCSAYRCFFCIISVFCHNVIQSFFEDHAFLFEIERISDWRRYRCDGIHWVVCMHWISSLPVWYIINSQRKLLVSFFCEWCWKGRFPLAVTDKTIEFVATFLDNDKFSHLNLSLLKLTLTSVCDIWWIDCSCLVIQKYVEHIWLWFLTRCYDGYGERSYCRNGTSEKWAWEWINEIETRELCTFREGLNSIVIHLN